MKQNYYPETHKGRNPYSDETMEKGNEINENSLVNYEAELFAAIDNNDIPERVKNIDQDTSELIQHNKKRINNKKQSKDEYNEYDEDDERKPKRYKKRNQKDQTRKNLSEILR